jgi:Zn ribbon nucleic-acid-binding protein
MKKSHGPTFKKRLIKLAECPVCQGRTAVQGVFHELACEACNASGWIDGWTRQALPLDELVIQLGMNLRVAKNQIEQLSKPPVNGPGAQYEQNNRRGVGGTNFTGD